MTIDYGRPFADRLVSEGMVIRSNGTLLLTDTGHAAADRLFTARREGLQELLADWSPDEYAELGDLLTKLSRELLGADADRGVSGPDHPAVACSAGCVLTFQYPSSVRNGTRIVAIQADDRQTPSSSRRSARAAGHLRRADARDAARRARPDHRRHRAADYRARPRRPEHLSWVVTAYLLASTVTTPLWGKLGDLYGRKDLFIAASSSS